MAGLIVSVVGVTPAFAVEPTPEFKEWWGRLTAMRDGVPNIDGIHLRYTLQSQFKPTQQQVDDLKREVEGFPEHPKRSTLAWYEESLKNAESAAPPTEYELWRFGDRWRFNAGSQGDYLDQTWGRDVGWQLSPKALVVVSPGEVAHTPYRIDRHAGAVLNHALLFINLGIGLPLWQGVALAPELNGDTWAVRAAVKPASQNGDLIRFEASGSWDATSGLGTVQRTKYTRVDAAGHAASTSNEATEWRDVPELALRLCSAVRTVDDAADVDDLLRLTEVSKFDEQEMERVAALPAFDGTDAIRGRATFTSIQDFRSGHVATTRRSDSSGTAITTVTQQPEETSNVLRIVGWASAAILGATFITLRVRKASG
jgi:hypothetical protein